MRKFWIIFCFFLFSGCAGAVQYAPFPKQSVGIENPNFARIYVVRPTHFGGLIPMTIDDGANEIGKTGANTFLCWERKPEEITLTGESENDAHLILDVKAGETYYVQQHVRMGFLYARNKLERLDPQKGSAYVKKAKPPGNAK